jgi:hypothetical protein
MTRGIVPALTVALLAMTACDMSQQKPKVGLVIHTGSLLTGASQSREGHGDRAADSTFARADARGRSRTAREISDDISSRLQGPGVNRRLQTRI